MKYRFLLFFILGFFIHNFSFASVGEDLKKIDIVFKYGTKSEIMQTLNFYRDLKPLKDESKAYFDKLDVLLKIGILDPEINFLVFDILKKNKLDIYNWYYKSLYDKLISQEYLDDNQKKLLSSLLYVMVDRKDPSYLEIFKSIREDIEKKFVGKGLYEPSVLTPVFKGLRELGEKIPAEEIKKNYADSKDVDFKQELLRSLVFLNNPDDTAFIKEVLEDPETPEIVKWVAIVELKEYGKNEKSLSILNEYARNSDISKGLKIRAIYALSFVWDKSEIRSLFLEGIRNDEEAVRLQYLEIAKRILDDEMIDFLKYKAKEDPSFKVQQKAKKILEDAGIKL